MRLRKNENELETQHIADVCWAVVKKQFADNREPGFQEWLDTQKHFFSIGFDMGWQHRKKWGGGK